MQMQTLQEKIDQSNQFKNFLQSLRLHFMLTLKPPIIGDLHLRKSDIFWVVQTGPNKDAVIYKE